MKTLFMHYIILIFLCESIIILIYHSFDIKLKKNIYQTAPYTYLHNDKKNNEQIIVFMLGESTRSDHFGINGYHRDTTPLLRQAKNLISFLNAHSSRLDTSANFKVLMSNYDSKKSFFDLKISESIFSIYSKLHFDTSLISTNIMTSLYSLYDRDIKNGEIHLLAGYDEKILPVLKDFIHRPQKNKFAMLHTYSGHHMYKQVIPDKKEFKKFNKILSPQTIQSNSCNCSWSLNGKLLDEIINDYDNTIVYTDFIIHSIIEMLKDKNAFFIYTSDHGESFGERGQTCLHCFDEPEVWHVPLIIWASDKWIETHKQQWIYINKALEDEKHNRRNISHRNIIASLLHCNNIKTDYIDENYSLCSEKFYPDFFEGCDRFEQKDCPQCNLSKSTPPSPQITTLYKDIVPVEQKFTQQPSFKEKAFIHAINSPQTLQEHLFEFTNFEIDVFIKNGNILTGHNPLKKEEALLEDILRMIPNKQHNIFWLDIKNLTTQNKNILLISLENLLQKYEIKNSQVIIESPAIENLGIFLNHGFITSFYFEDIDLRDTTELTKRVRKYNDYPTICISSDIKYSSIIQYLFPQQCHLFWNVDEENSQNILNSQQTKAVILSRPL